MVSRKGSAFAGVGVAIVTPFRDGKLDVKRLQEQIEFQITSGVTFLVPVGTTGESPTLSHDEHRDVIKAAVEIVAGRIKVIGGTYYLRQGLQVRPAREREGVEADGRRVLGRR
jgi:4-hydroxy-tetrahydrodipicolinate synthase